MDNQFESIQLRRVIKNEISLNVEEEKIKERVKRRKPWERSKLFGRRIATFAVNLLFLVGGWVLIILINFYSTQITDYFSKYRFISTLVRN